MRSEANVRRVQPPMGLAPAWVGITTCGGICSRESLPLVDSGVGMVEQYKPRQGPTIPQNVSSQGLMTRQAGVGLHSGDEQ